MKNDPILARRAGFTLVELLVVIGIIALLVGILLPTLGRARQAARDVQCASNIRQLATSMILYSAENEGAFAPNINVLRPAPTQPGVPTANQWFDDDRIGRYLPETVKPSTTTVNPTLAGGVMRCPDDIEAAERSYAMNIWASSTADQFVLNRGAVRASYGGSYAPGRPFRGQIWGANVSNGSQMILFAEAHPKFSTPTGFFAAAGVGFQGDFPGDRFTGMSGFTIGSGDFGGGPYPFAQKNAEVAMHRHAREIDPEDGLAAPVDTFGRANFAMADGHVEMREDQQLADPETHISTLELQWSPLDPEIVAGRLSDGGGDGD